MAGTLPDSASARHGARPARSGKQRRRANRRRAASLRARKSDDPKDVERDTGTPTRNSLRRPLHPAVPAEIPLKFEDVLWEVVGRAWVSAQRIHGVLIRAWCPAQTEVDPSRVHRGQRARTAQRSSEGRMVGQHHPRQPRVGLSYQRSNMGDKDTGSRRGNARNVVVLGVPDTLVAQLFQPVWASTTLAAKPSPAVSPRPIGAKSSIEIFGWVTDGVDQAQRPVLLRSPVFPNSSRLSPRRRDTFVLVCIALVPPVKRTRGPAIRFRPAKTSIRASSDSPRSARKRCPVSSGPRSPASSSRGAP